MAYLKGHLESWVFDTPRGIPDLPPLPNKRAAILPPQQKAIPALPPPEVWHEPERPVTSEHENVEIHEPSEKLRALDVISQQHASAPWDRVNRLQSEFIAKQEREIAEKSFKITILETQAANLGVSLNGLRRRMMAGAIGLMVITGGGTIFATVFFDMSREIEALKKQEERRSDRERDALVKAQAEETTRQRAIAEAAEQRRIAAEQQRLAAERAAAERAAAKAARAQRWMEGRWERMMPR